MGFWLLCFIVNFIYTKKRALQGWQEWISHDEFKDKDITLINYEANYHHTNRYDIAILDESHNYISSYPKPSVTLKKLLPIVMRCNLQISLVKILLVSIRLLLRNIILSLLKSS